MFKAWHHGRRVVTKNCSGSRAMMIERIHTIVYFKVMITGTLGGTCAVRILVVLTFVPWTLGLTHKIILQNSKWLF